MQTCEEPATLAQERLVRKMLLRLVTAALPISYSPALQMWCVAPLKFWIWRGCGKVALGIVRAR